MAKKNTFELSFIENTKKDRNLPTTDALNFDDLGDFVQERDKIQRIIDLNSETSLKVDYSNFSNHVFFDSAVSKFGISKSRVLTQYPFNGSSEAKDSYFFSGTGYDKYIFNQWPRFVGYSKFNGVDQYISASDFNRTLVLGTSSFMVSAWVNVDPYAAVSYGTLISNAFMSASDLDGYYINFIPGSSVSCEFLVTSGTTYSDLIVDYSPFVDSWNHVAAVYDRDIAEISLYVNSVKVGSASCVLGPIEQRSVVVSVGRDIFSKEDGFEYQTGYYSGSIDELRIYHTASELLIQNQYNRIIDSENYLKLYYKFNEGIVGQDNVDKVIVDYSKNSIHGTYEGYTSESRVSGSARFVDPGDVILYSFHPDVVSFSSSMELSATIYDNLNNNLIFNLIPESILREDDNTQGLMSSFALGLARYFDQIKGYFDQFENIRITNYQDKNEVPDLFLPTLSKYFGWKVSDHYGAANPAQFFLGRGISGSDNLQTVLVDIRNEFWSRTLNNLPYLIQSKGKRTSIDAYLNVFGVGKENIRIKEYGYLPGGSIEDTRINREKPVPVISFNKPELTGSYIKVPSLVSSAPSEFTVETLLQLPYESAEFSASFVNTQGSIWQLVDNDLTGSVSLIWSYFDNGQGYLILTGSDGQSFSTEILDVFDGDFCNVAAGLSQGGLPFIEVRTVDNGTIDYSISNTGSVAFSGVFTGSNYDFIIGATSGSIYQKTALGYCSECRYWIRRLSGSEIDSHVLHFENVGIRDPSEFPHPLKMHLPLNENVAATISGEISAVKDLSRNGYSGVGYNFEAGENPYTKFLFEYNYLSPNIDLKWTENKIRISDKKVLTKKDLATDTNEVSLEFNLVDALNEDISKIFSTMEIINNAIGAPVNKYRDEYSDLEAYRTLYFERLGDSINFNNFFKLFKWFDRRISDAIKQLLPARVKFIGGEQVVENHFLERPKYGYKYPIFRTPKDIPNADLTGSANVDSHKMASYTNEKNMMGTSVSSEYERNTKYTRMGLNIKPQDSCVGVEGWKSPNFISMNNQGEGLIDGKSNNQNLSFERIFEFATNDNFISELVEDMSGGLFAIGQQDSQSVLLQCKEPRRVRNSVGIYDSFSTVFISTTSSFSSLCVDSSGNIFLSDYKTYPPTDLKTWKIFKGNISDPSQFVEVDNISTAFGVGNSGSDDNVFKIRADSQDNIYAIIQAHTASSLEPIWVVRRSVDHGQTFQNVDYVTGAIAGYSPVDMDFGKDNMIYVCGYGDGQDSIRSSSDGVVWSGSLSSHDGNYQAFSRIAVDKIQNYVYVYGTNYTTLYRSFDSGKTFEALYGGDYIHKSIYPVTDMFGRVYISEILSQDYGFAEGLSGSIRLGNSNFVGSVTSGTFQFYPYIISDYFSGDPTIESQPILTMNHFYVSPNYPGVFYVSISDYNNNIESEITKGYVLSNNYFNPHISFSRYKVSGDQNDEINNPQSSINSRNEFARKLLDIKDRDNE